MRHKLYFLVPLAVLAAALLLVRLWPAQQEPIQPTSGIQMLPATVPVAAHVQAATARILAENAPDLGVFAFAVTDVARQDGYYYVSVAGMPTTATEMHLAESIWLGVVILTDVPGLPGMLDTQMPTMASADATDLAAYDRGGSQALLPFRDGTTALYGVLGVHDCGFTLNGWKAVDLFPAENMVYASAAGSVSYVCRDPNQVALRVGTNLYTHLVDTGQQIGDSYSQGQAMAGMVPGSYDTACGYAAQQEDHYHVHFCFIPNTVGIFSADGYNLSMADSKWYKDAEEVEPLGTLTADWANAGVTPPGAATAGGNFWDSFIGGVISMATNSASILPEHQNMNMVSMVLKSVSPALELINLFFGVFNMDVAKWCMGIILLLETVRIIYAGYMLVKRLIPVVG